MAITSTETAHSFQEQLTDHYGIKRKDFLVALRHVENVFSLVVYLNDNVYSTRLPHKFNKMEVHKVPMSHLTRQVGMY